VESIKVNLNTQFSNLNGEIEKFKLRWDTLKPKEEALEGGPERILQGIKYETSLFRFTRKKRSFFACWLS
jgi:hypothetical protein